MSLLKQAIVDASNLKEAALKNAEQLILEKYSNEILKIIDEEFQLSRIKIILTKCKPPITGFDGEVSIVRVFENN